MTSLNETPVFFVGIDLALRRVDLACLNEAGELQGEPLASRSETDEEAIRYCVSQPGKVIAGIDAPFQFAVNGNWRECDKYCQRNKMPLYSPNAPGFAPVVERAIRLIEALEKEGVECKEVYPFSARVRLKVGVGMKKQQEAGRQAIQNDLARFVELPPEPLGHDALDAVLAAYTVWLDFHGLAESVGGEDGMILMPKPLEQIETLIPGRAASS